MRKFSVVLSAVLLVLCVGGVQASSQQCPIDGGPCTGGGKTPVPPKCNVICKLKKVFFKHHSFDRR
jgi:hypothetical protein